MTAAPGTALAAALPRWHAAATPEPVDIPRDPAQEQAREELSKPIYHQDDPSWFRQAFDWVMDRFGDLLDRIGTAAPGGGIGALLILAVLVGAVIALRLKLGPVRTARRGRREALFPADGPRTSADYRAAADAHAAAGAWGEAVQDRLRAIVRALEERALLDERPGRTADEAADEAGRQLPALAAALLSAALMFDDVRYGGRPGTEAMDRELRDLDRQCAATRPVREAVPAGPDRTPQ
ncbi:DUF4129 domain-containing protein [Yinghuangia soli]|uniref:DUF4129 domain-containing protein n=1 Tax=Yinghuangia soli TaxID=2908204 RepID=A0AA41Q9U0_9ACTN|nr:DUF4129 domain-containing protein [Yinghuangia soli]MCF2534053.1 DUF4129 domain-containing protein [Yinghuangia soli]